MEKLDNLKRYALNLSDEELESELSETEFEVANANNGLGIWISTALEDAKKGNVYHTEMNISRLINHVKDVYHGKNQYKMIFRGLLDMTYTNGLAKEQDIKKIRTYQIKRALIRVPDFEEDLDIIVNSGYQDIRNYANEKLDEINSHKIVSKVRNTKERIVKYFSKGK